MEDVYEMVSVKTYQHVMEDVIYMFVKLLCWDEVSQIKIWEINSGQNTVL